jgi:hypothetical protein
MPRLDFAVLCEHHLIDRYDGRASAIGIFYDIRPKRVPFRIAQFVVFSSWRLDQQDSKTDFQASLEIIQSAENRKTYRANLKPTSASAWHQVFQRFRGMRIENSGDLLFKFVLNDRVMGELSVKVHPPDEASNDPLNLTYPHLPAKTGAQATEEAPRPRSRSA